MMQGKWWFKAVIYLMLISIVLSTFVFALSFIPF